MNDGFVHLAKQPSGIISGTGAGSITMVEVSEIVCVGNSQGFFTIMTNELLTEAPIPNGLACAGTKENEHKQ